MLKTEERTLVLDMGGTAVKAAVFGPDGEIEKEGAWRHAYRDLSFEQAREHLVRESREFASGNVGRVGLSIAGLLADDESLFRSTVLTAFEGVSFAEMFHEALGVHTVSTDNDADCGAVGEHMFVAHELFYIVAGSGIGSAYVDDKGRLKYLVRIDRSIPYSDTMNHPISDVGLRLLIPKDEIFEWLKQFGVSRERMDRVLVPQNRQDGKGLTEEGESILLGRLGSATGVRAMLEILWNGRFHDDDVQQHYNVMIQKNRLKRRVALTDLYSENYAAAPIAELARVGDEHCARAYALMGAFLGVAIAKAQGILLEDLRRHPAVHLGGQIMASGDLFLSHVNEAVSSYGVGCECTVSSTFRNKQNANLWGAYALSMAE